jgi:hypothetical protein
VFGGGDGRQLWQWWTIERTFNGGGGGGVRWLQQRLTAFDGVGDGLRREDKRAAQGQATHQPASTMRGREGGATRGQQEMMARQPAGETRKREATRRENKTTRGWRVERRRNAPRFRGHGDSQTVVFFLPKLRPAIFTARKFCAMSLAITTSFNQYPCRPIIVAC